jgi:hypothetical protein
MGFEGLYLRSCQYDGTAADRVAAEHVTRPVLPTSTYHQHTHPVSTQGIVPLLAFTTILVQSSLSLGTELGLPFAATVDKDVERFL